MILRYNKIKVTGEIASNCWTRRSLAAMATPLYMVESHVGVWDSFQLIWKIFTQLNLVMLNMAKNLVVQMKRTFLNSPLRTLLSRILENQLHIHILQALLLPRTFQTMQAPQSTRGISEKAFRILANRWRVFMTPMLVEPEKAENTTIIIILLFSTTTRDQIRPHGKCIALKAALTGKTQLVLHGPVVQCAIGEHAFSYATRTLWNALPLRVHACTALHILEYH